MDAFVGKPLTPEKLRRVFVAAGRRKLAAASFPAPASLPVHEVDLGLLHYLSDGSADGMSAEIQRFIAGLRAAEEKMTAASRAGDFAGLRASAHQVIGHAKMIGGAALAEAARQLESAARLGDGLACGASLDHLHREIASVTESMIPRQSAARPV
jgi:HPt (histidine-containing phosphotransfer) domain-containing protein